MRDYWIIRVDLILKSCVEVLLSQSVRNNYQKELDLRSTGIGTRLLFLTFSWWVLRNVFSKVWVYSLFEIINSRLVIKGNNISIINKYVKVVFLWQTVKFILQVSRIFNIFFKTKYCPFLEVNGLLYDWSQNVCVIKRFLSSPCSKADCWSFQYFSFDFIRFKLDIEIPFLYLLWFCDHFVDLFYTCDSVVWLLE